MITGRQKRALEDHFDREPALERALELKGDLDRLEAVRHASSLGPLHYVRQGDPKGLGHAVLCARQHVGDEPFAVLLGDDLIDERDELLTAMIEVQAEDRRLGGGPDRGGSGADQRLRLRRHLGGAGEDYVRVNRLVEKPAVAEAPSNLAVIGRYVLHPEVFDVLEDTAPGRGGEIQLTDALQTLAVSDCEGGGVYGVVFRGRRYDTGDKLSYLKAVISIAADRVEFGEELKAWMKAFVS